MDLHTFRRASRRAAAWACAWVLHAPACAAIVATGSYGLFPGPGPLGPGDTYLPDDMLWLGISHGAATLDVDGGSQLTIAYLNSWGDGVGTTVARIHGVGTRVNLAAPGGTNRFAAGNVAGASSVIVSGGAVLDGTYLRDRCASGPACQNVVGAAAGSQGVLTVTGAGSEARFLRPFHVGNLAYNGASGIRGRDGMGLVEVLDGGALTTEYPVLGAGYAGPELDGTEKGIAQVRISGGGSRWTIAGSDILGGAVRLVAATDRQGVTSLEVSGGATLHMLASPAGLQSEALLGTGGSVLATVAGTGSVWRMDGDGSNGYLRLAAGGGDAVLKVIDGGLLHARISSLGIGIGSGRGEFHVMGSGSVALIPDATVHVGDPAESDASGSGWLHVTRDGSLHARRIEIARYGLLSGSGLVEAETIVNRGTISPGDSPGALTLVGRWVNTAGSRLVLEIDGDAGGGYSLDELHLSDLPDLSSLDIEFRFLGATDPRLFLASGLFDIDRFIDLSGAPLADSAFDGVHFTATSRAFEIRDFRYSASGGASFVASPISSPDSMALVGLALLIAARRRAREPVARSRCTP